MGITKGLEADSGSIELKAALLHEPLFIAGTDGKGINLTANLQVMHQSGTQIGLKLRLQGNFVYVTTKTAYALVPVESFKCLIPLNPIA